MIGAIAFVPEHDVPMVWRLLKPRIPADMLPFVNYYESTWIGTSSRNPLFSHDIWNFHPDAASTEYEHRWGLASWIQLDALLPQPDSVEVPGLPESGTRPRRSQDLKMTRRLMQENSEPRAPKWVRYEAQLQRILEKYDSYANPMDFLKAVGNMLWIL